jgi:hypothetical protein
MIMEGDDNDDDGRKEERREQVPRPVVRRNVEWNRRRGEGRGGGG